MKKMKKTIFTLNVNNGVDKDITDLTYPYLKKYAHKIGAEFFVITERKFPDWYITYEKLQIYDLAKEMQNDWNIYIDCDALIHPDLFDITNHLSKDTVAHNATDMADLRWKYDEYFLRDGRFIGSCNWFTIASDWCLDLWKPFDDLTPDQAYENIFPTKSEIGRDVKPQTLIDDYALSRNIARFGLKFVESRTFFEQFGQIYTEFLFHQYARPSEEKVILLKDQMDYWGLPKLKK